MDTVSEEIIEPSLPIVDPHHHVWYIPDAMLDALDASTDIDGVKIARTYRLHRRYLFDEFLADTNSGHNIVATVFADAHTMYRASGQDAMKSVGEIEFVTGLAAMSASGIFGSAKLIAGVELMADKATRTPFAPEAKVGILVQDECQKAGLVVRAIGDRIAFTPPLIITAPDLQEMVLLFRRAPAGALAPLCG